MWDDLEHDTVISVFTIEFSTSGAVVGVLVVGYNVHAAALWRDFSAVVTFAKCSIFVFAVWTVSVAIADTIGEDLLMHSKLIFSGALGGGFVFVIFHSSLACVFVAVIPNV